MKKLLTLLLAVTFLIGSDTFIEANMNYERVSEKTLATSVLIHAKVHITDRKGKVHEGMIGCSGTYVSDDEVLSAAHCFEMTPSHIWVRGIDGKSYSAEIIKLDPSHDLSLLKVPNMKHKYAKVGKKLKVGEEIMNIGTPFSLEFLVSTGIVSSLHVAIMPFASLYTITTAMINPGSSGGGMFNKHGELVGVNTMSMGAFGWNGISLTVSVEDVRIFLGMK